MYNEISILDKEKVKQLIDQAMKGLEEAGRIESSGDAASWDQAQATAVHENYKSTISELEDHLNKWELLFKELIQCNFYSILIFLGSI